MVLNVVLFENHADIKCVSRQFEPKWLHNFCQQHIPDPVHHHCSIDRRKRIDKSVFLLWCFGQPRMILRIYATGTMFKPPPLPWEMEVLACSSTMSSGVAILLILLTASTESTMSTELVFLISVKDVPNPPKNPESA